MYSPRSVRSSLAIVIIGVAFLAMFLSAGAFAEHRITGERALIAAPLLFCAFGVPLSLLAWVSTRVSKRLQPGLGSAFLNGASASFAFLWMVFVLDTATSFGVGVPVQCQPLFNLGTAHVLGATALPFAFVLLSLVIRRYRATRPKAFPAA